MRNFGKAGMRKKKTNNFVGARTTFKPALSNSVVLALRTREKFG